MCDNGSHVHTHYGHVHTEEETKAVVNRISRVIGHLESIKRMVAEDRDCNEVLIQLSAVRSAINGVGKLVLQNHIEHCIVDAVQNNEMNKITELSHAIDIFMK